MDVKRPKEDGAATSGTGAADKEHTMLMKVLQPTSSPAEKLSFESGSLSQFLEDEASRLARQHPAKGLEEAVLFLARGWRRSEEGGVVPSTWPGIVPFQEAVLTTAKALLLAATSEEKVRGILSLLDASPAPRLMNDLLATAAEEDEAVPAELLRSICRGLRGRSLADARSSQLSKLIRVLKSSKRYTAALVESPLREEIWKPAFEAKFVWRNRKREVVAQQRQGMDLQVNSLLGWVFAPTALDAAFVPPSQAHLTEAGSTEWAEMRRATRQRLENIQRGTQMKVTGSQSQGAELVDVMLRSGDGPRMAVLEWLGELLSSAEPRGKQGHVAPEGFNLWPQYGNHLIEVLQHNETPPFQRSLKNMLLLQALHARIHGFPSSGVALNAFSVLLHLCKPIKSDHDSAAAISAFFPLRKDVPSLLGSWEKEARFGEKAQVEAAEEVAKGNAGFTADAGDKKLFKTEVFWLATKGLGTLLLPVAKEAFHTMQNIVSVFFHKDPTTSDIASREFLIAEALLKEPSFLDQLGHFVDLTFRFLLHHAAGGKEALPPPTPGPEWHVLPSTILENILELCDLYRDRQKKAGGIPSGLYLHIDPTPLLTTLCIVMASDEHVRDPSLRGRAVKLLHRLCFEFRDWQEKLSQPPLVNHFIPCLVGVFIAVEKAILSYYDLSYRYKYELRIPVMDLFDLVLQNEEHRRVLHDFSKGSGNDKFLKLLTQLINDSNSQTEEAIRTVKEAKVKDKAVERPAASSPSSSSSTGAHDEQVLDDDQAEGEDVYRRSRMNYKEHAKKYFGLSTKTWKTLWLLCKHCATVIVEGKTILEQLLHTSLDANLHFLVGPEMASIKSSPQDYDELGFNPKELVRQIVEIYLFLARSNRDEVARIVAKDERYYSPATFTKAFVFVRKYGLVPASDLADFEQLVKELEERVSQQRAAFNQADIPDKFLCEMMADIMSDPVMFPQSKKVVDRCTAVRQIMSNDRDPYANTEVRIEDLIPLPDLKEEIHRFAKEKGIALEGGNMFDRAV